MRSLFLVMAGGAIGAGLRHLVGGAALRALGPAFPWGTLIVNVAGSLAMGVLAGVLARGTGGETWRLFMGVGVLGGFTTFSAFSLDAVSLIERGQAPLAAAYAVVSVTASLAALAVGLMLVRSVA
jgi:fluoride exporter